MIEAQMSELESIKQIADNMGIAYKSNIKLETLREKVENQRKAVEGQKPNSSLKLNGVTRARMEANKLVRCIVTPADPALRESAGEFFNVSNAVIGNVHKFIAFNLEYHVPAIILGVIRETKYRQSYKVKDPATGRMIDKSRTMPRYNITELDPLTVEEIQALAEDQIKRGIHDEDK